MAACRDESDAFVFDWRLEVAREFERYHLEIPAQSPVFVVHALNKTEWYCEFSEGNLFSLYREYEFVGPEETEVNWKASVLKPDGTVASSDVRSFVFLKGGSDRVEFDLGISEFVDQSGIVRFRCSLWGHRLHISEFQGEASTPGLLSDDSDLAVDGIASGTLIAMFPRYCSGVTAKKAERICVCLDTRCLDLLATEGELSTIVTSASGVKPNFYIKCSMVGTSEFLKIEVKRVGKRAFYVLVEIALVDAEGETSHGTSKFHSFTKKFHTLTIEDLVKKSDLTPTDSDEDSPRSLQFTLTFCSDFNDVWIENTTFPSQKILRHPRMERICAPRESPSKQTIHGQYADRKPDELTHRMENGTLEAHKTGSEPSPDGLLDEVDRYESPIRRFFRFLRNKLPF